MAHRHNDDDDLERYALVRLADTAPVEEHLLACEECRGRLAGRDAYVGSVRAAMRRAALNRR
jgi:predicted anti-sigma-YlaC factor YlaD